jgi:hypothetical protein
MDRIEFKTSKLKIIIAKNPFRVIEISDLRNHKIYCKEGIQSIIIRSPLHISDPVLLSEVSRISYTKTEINFTLKDESETNFADFILTEHDKYGLKFSLTINSSEVIWLAEWKLTGFDFDNVIVPALGGQMLTSDMPSETTVSYKYPFWWNAQFVIGEKGKDGIWLHTKDASSDLKLLRVTKREGDYQLALGFESKAPLVSNQLNAEWYLDCYSDSWEIPVNIHREWLEKTFNLKSLSQNVYFPNWANDVNIILELWGMRKDQPEPHHTFDQMKIRLKEWQQYHPPVNTLLYIPGFAENGIDSHAPDYNPSAKCGGEEKFIELMEYAHELKYKVMLHTNVLAMTFTHPLFDTFKKYQVIDPFNRSQGWAMDIDGDWLAEEFFAYMNPGFKQWGDLMEGVIGNLINKYKTDAVFLDQTLLAFNVSNGPDFLHGMKNHILRLQAAFPETLFAGEGLNEQVLQALPFVQIHGIDSLSEVHGMEGKKKWKKVHPVSTYLFGKYSRFSAHLLTKYPSNPMFKLQENSYKYLDVIPALSLYDNNQKMNIPEVHKMIKRAKTLSAKYKLIETEV